MIGDRQSDRQIDPLADSDDRTGAVHTRHMAGMPVGMSPVDEFPVDRIEADCAVGDQRLPWTGYRQRLAAEAQRFALPGPDPCTSVTLIFSRHCFSRAL